MLRWIFRHAYRAGKNRIAIHSSNIGPSETRNRRDTDHEVHHALVAVDRGIAEARPNRIRQRVGRDLVLFSHRRCERGELDLLRQQATLSLHPLDFFAHPAELGFHLQHVRQLAGALTEQVEQALLGIARVAEPGFEIDILRGDVLSVLRLGLDTAQRLQFGQCGVQLAAGTRSVAVSLRAPSEGAENVRSPTYPLYCFTILSIPARALSRFCVTTVSCAVRRIIGAVGASAACFISRLEAKLRLLSPLVASWPASSLRLAYRHSHVGGQLVAVSQA